MLDRYFSAEADMIDGSNNELDFSERSLPNYMRNTKSREMAINDQKKTNKYKLFSPQGMADQKKPSATTLMSSSSVLSLGRQKFGQDSRRILSPTEQHSNNMILGPPKTP